MRAVHRILAALFLATAACSGGGPTGPRDPDQPPPAADRFAVSTSALSFAPSENEQTVRLENHGADPVPWRAEASAGWLTVTPSGGSLPPGEALARIVIQRASLPIGTHSAEARFYLDEVLFMVAVTAENPGQALARVQPAAVRLGPDTGAATVTVSNAGSAPLAWSMSGPAWLSIQPAQGTLAAGSSLPVALAPDRPGLSDGLHEGQVALTSDGGSLAVAVSVEVASPAHLRLSPTAVDFGTSASTRTVTIVNEGGRALDWSATEDAPWLTLSATSGSVAPHASQAVTLAAARSGLDDGEHQTTLTVSSNGGEGALTVRIDAAGASPPPSPPPPPPPP
ncbi:MAG: BACON domain-containing protein, partial [Gemmatimonadetes bacterium]|nr:BACON domain-containing protein [Gemmatimonadota bacterium]